MTARLAVLSWAVLAWAGCSDSTAAGDVLVVGRVEVDPSSAALIIGEELQLSAAPMTASGIPVPNRSIAWSSLAPDIASVSEEGVVTAHSKGQADILAVVDGTSGTASVNVAGPAIAWIVVQPKDFDLKVGRTRQLTVFLLDADGDILADRAVQFVSDDPAIAAVSNTGLVVGVNPGETVIRVRAEGKEGTSSVDVNR
ncbi:MAG TPA: Ig-like domain-containing protein [Gemmatimonadales bacterium]|nr:Ig-like domain-containing protein [Gemmatimonadales bacterium]